MTRTILVIVTVGAFLSVISGPGCAPGGVGDPCTPEQEYDICFAGFDEAEVNVESKSFQCQTRLCLVNHFRGRVSCPYGQSAGTSKISSGPGCTPGANTSCCGLVGGEPIAPYYPNTGTSSCTIPGGSTVLGDAGSVAAAYQVQVAVLPQVTPRETANAVYCSCRCANTSGATDDGSVYCSCPDGYLCTQLVTSIGTSEQGLTGGYCIKTGSAYDSSNLAGQLDCCPAGGPCVTPNPCSLPE
jgi:hypothetical protein